MFAPPADRRDPPAAERGEPGVRSAAQELGQEETGIVDDETDGPPAQAGGDRFDLGQLGHGRIIPAFLDFTSPPENNDRVPSDTSAPAFDRDMGRISSLSGFLFAPPRVRTLLLFWFAELVVFALWGYDGLPGFRFPLVLLAFSASGCLLARPLSKWAGGDIIFANALFLSLSAVFVLAILLKAGAPAAKAMGLVTGLDILVFATLAGLRTLRAAIPAAAMSAAAFLAWKGFAPGSSPDPAACLVVMGLAWALCGVFFAIVSRPMRRIGLDFLDLFTRVLGDYAGGEPSKTDPFSSAGIETGVRCQTIVIERAGSVDALVVPWIHPGPVGSLGGDFPARLRRSLSGAFRRVVFLHTYVDHTRNPAGRDAALAGIAAAALRAAGGEPLGGSSTPFRRERRGNATAAGLKIDGLPLIFTTFAPEHTDDIAPEAGSRLLSELDGEAVLVDGHNSLGSGKERSRSIADGDPRLDNLAEAIADVRRTLGAEPARPLEIGISERAIPASGIRHCSAVVFRTGLETSAVIALEANNLPAGMREDILDSIGSLGIEKGEVVTTDSHHADIPALTEAGWNGAGRAVLLDSVRAAVREAVADLRPARIRYGDETISLRVWGPLFEKIVRAVPRTARLGLIAGAGLILLFWIASGMALGWLR